MPHDSFSDSLITEILDLLQDLSTNMDEFKQKLDKIDVKIGKLNEKINRIVSEGFPNGDMYSHKKWHEKSRRRHL